MKQINGKCFSGYYQHTEHFAIMKNSRKKRNKISRETRKYTTHMIITPTNIRFFPQFIFISFYNFCFPFSSLKKTVFVTFLIRHMQILQFISFHF